MPWCQELASFIRSLSGLGLTSASITGEAIFKQAAIKATEWLVVDGDDWGLFRNFRNMFLYTIFTFAIGENQEIQVDMLIGKMGILLASNIFTI